MSWEKVKLAEVCKSISDGDHQPPPKSESGIPFVTISNITNANKFDFTNTMFVPREYYDSLDEKRRAQIGDILYSVVGSFGIPVYMDEEKEFVFQRHIAILRPDSEKIVPKFLYYTMLNRDFYMKADAVALGAAQRTVSLTALRGMEIQLPECAIQKKIVEILKPYDNLIENNQKQIKLLEEAAQRLYKEWFVDLRFPGHKECKIVDGVPEGWKRKKISDLGEIVTGKTPSTSKEQYYGGDIPFVKIPDMHGCVYPIATESTLTKEGADTQKNKFIPKNGIMVSLYYVYSTMRRLKTMLDGVGSNGATMTNVNKTKFGNIKIFYPDEQLRKAYYVFCKPIFEKIFALSMSNNKLAGVRDRLLPKLMNGEIEV